MSAAKMWDGEGALQTLGSPDEILEEPVGRSVSRRISEGNIEWRAELLISVGILCVMAGTCV